MDKFLSITVGGFATGAIYAVAASGLVLTYATTGTFNFAHGAIGMVAAFLYWQVHVAWGWSTPVSLVAVLLVAAPLFGVGLERLIMRRLEGTSETTRLVVTISLLLGLLGFSVAMWAPGTNRPMRQFFQGNVLELAGIRIPWHQLVSLAAAAAVAIGLRLLLYGTRRGITMRASVDNRSLVALNGSRPEHSAMVSWALGCSLAALSGILIAPTLTLSAVPLTLLIVNAYGAAIFGRLQSLPLTFVGAMVIGLATSYGIGYLSSLPTDLQPYARGLVDALPAIVLLAVVWLLPASRLAQVTRTREIAAKPSWGGAIALAVASVVGSAMLAPLLTTGELVSIGRLWGIAIVGLSMIPVIGLSGQLSLSQLTFAGFGAVAYAHLGWANPLGLVWAALVAGVVAGLVALPLVRLQGIYVALATAAFTVLCDRWLFPLPEFSIGSRPFQFFPGSLPVVRPHLLGIDLTSPTASFVYASVVFALLALLVVAIRRSAFGARLIAIKEGPAAVATAGISVAAVKVGVFALSGAIAGIGGAILSSSSPATVSQFDLVAGLPILLVMVVGGITSVGAPVFAGVFLGSPLPTKLMSGHFDLGRWQNALIGLVGVSVGRNPNGVSAALNPAGRRVKADLPVAAALIVALGTAWGLRITETISNGPYVALTIAALVGSVWLARRRLPEAISLAELDSVRGVASGATAPMIEPELLGLTVPYTPEAVAALDEALDLASAGRRVEVSSAGG
ncbi:MAG: ABC transporter permease [Acidimicrobiales bacterium]|nr:ABC transporter permease [Acidimicrobiales bacterium]